jgi:pyridoxine 4-dehydrogenase
MPTLVGKEINGTGYGLMGMLTTSSSFVSSLQRSRKEIKSIFSTHCIFRISLLTRYIGLTWSPTPASESKYTETLNTALTLGANFWNGGELYGTPDYNSLHMLNNYFSKHPEVADKIVLSIKGGLIPGQLVADCSEANVRRSVDECLRVLDGTKSIDIFECARLQPSVPVEEVIGTLAKLVQEGKIKAIGLSEVDADTIRRA